MTVSEAAYVLGVSEQRVRKLLADGKLKGMKRGRDWFVSNKSVMERAHNPHPRRPRIHALLSAIDANGRESD